MSSLENYETQPLERKLTITKDELRVCKATPGSRIGGSILDIIIEVILLVILIIAVMDKIDLNNPEVVAEEAFTYLLIYQVISFFFTLIIPVITKGQTLGKLAVGTRIISIDGNIGNLVLYLVRSLFYTIIALLGQIPGMSELSSSISFIISIASVIMLFSESHGRTVQDMFARTMVVDDKIYKNFRQRRFHELDHPEEYIIPQEESLEESINTQGEFV